MQLNPSEISELIKKARSRTPGRIGSAHQGTVVSVTDGICRVHGLQDVMQGEMLEFPGNTFGMALNLERDSVGAVVLGEYEHISEGDDTVKTTGRILEVPSAPGTARPRRQLPRPADRRQGSDQRQADRQDRKSRSGRHLASVRFPAGADRSEVVDSMVPVGRGQRELIIGDRQTGKTAVAVDAIINQKGKDLFCVYVAIGQKASTHRQRGAQAGRARRHGIHHRRRRLRFRIRRAAVHRPYSGCTMGEYFRDRGQDALIIYDDLTKQAWGYRQVSCCCAVRPAAKPTRATCSISTPSAGARRSRFRCLGREADQWRSQGAKPVR